jgi:hypothetical protein
MKRSLMLGVVVALGALFVFLLRRQSSSPPVEVKASPAISIRHEAASRKPAAATGAGADYSLAQPTAVDAAAARAEAYVVIDDASTTYDERAVAAIAPYLAHADLEIRKMALDGLLRAGEISAAPVLRAAGAKLTDPREATTYLDAADYLELPARKRSKKSAAPSPMLR